MKLIAVALLLLVLVAGPGLGGLKPVSTLIVQTMTWMVANLRWDLAMVTSAIVAMVFHTCITVRRPLYSMRNLEFAIGALTCVTPADPVVQHAQRSNIHECSR